MFKVFEDRRDRLNAKKMRADSALKSMQMTYTKDELQGLMQMPYLTAKFARFDAETRLNVYSVSAIRKSHSRIAIENHLRKTLKKISIDKQGAGAFARLSLEISEKEMRFALDLLNPKERRDRTFEFKAV